MAANMFIPPWMQVQYNPVQTFLKAFQTGAQIRQAQTKLAEEQRQANMQAQARQEQLQQNALLEAARIQTEKAYRQQQAQLGQAKLAEDAKQAKMAQDVSLARIKEQQDYHNALIAAQNAPDQKLLSQQAFATEYQSNLRQGQTPEVAYRNALIKSPSLLTPTTIPALAGQNKGNEAMQNFVQRMELQNVAKQLNEARKQVSDPNSLLSPQEQTQVKNNIAQLMEDYKTRAGAITNAPPPFAPPQGLPFAGAPKQQDEVLALPEKKEDLEEGKLYRTGRGIARWNGSAFEKQ